MGDALATKPRGRRWSKQWRKPPALSCPPSGEDQLRGRVEAPQLSTPSAEKQMPVEMRGREGLGVSSTVLTQQPRPGHHLARCREEDDG